MNYHFSTYPNFRNITHVERELLTVKNTFLQLFNHNTSFIAQQESFAFALESSLVLQTQLDFCMYYRDPIINQYKKCT